MAKTVRSSKKIPKIGYFTETQRKHVKNNQISKDDRYKLLKIPNGRLFKQLVGQIDDLHLMIKNKELSSWLIDYNVKNELGRLEGVLDKISRFHVIPLRRLAAKSKDGKRMYHLKRIDNTTSSETEIKKESYRRKQMIVGLKPYEKNFVLQYIEKIGYNMPLEEGVFYTWEQVKKSLSEMINKKDEPITKKDEEILDRRIIQAWKMIDKIINQKQKNEIISKTGFGIGLIPYSQFK